MRRRPYIDTSARTKAFTNQYGYTTEVYPTFDGLPGSESRMSYVRVDDPKEVQDAFDRNRIGEATRVNYGYKSLYLGDDGFGYIRNNKTPAQIREQLARIERNASYLQEHDDSRKEIKRRLRTVRGIVQAKEDFDNLGVPQNASTAAKGNSVH